MSILKLDKYTLKSEVINELPTVIDDINDAVEIIDLISAPSDLPCLNEYNSFELDVKDIKKKIDHINTWFSTSVSNIDATNVNVSDNISLLPDDRVLNIEPRIVDSTK